MARRLGICQSCGIMSSLEVHYKQFRRHPDIRIAIGSVQPGIDHFPDFF